MENCRILNADCIRTLRLMKARGVLVDSVITDPPYHLQSIVKRFGKDGSAPAKFGRDGAFSRLSSGFLQQKWDGGDIAFRRETWEAVMSVMKPGAYLLAFAATRNYHRMACAIEDAGFEIRDLITWVYGCLDEETEILTNRGFMRYNEIDIGDSVYAFDKDTGLFHWERPERILSFWHDDTAIRIFSDSTDQLLTPDHNCLIERDGAWVFEKASALQHEVCAPILEGVSGLQWDLLDKDEIPSTEEQGLRLSMRYEDSVIPKTTHTQVNGRPKNVKSSLLNLWKRVLEAFVPPKESRETLLFAGVQWECSLLRKSIPLAQREQSRVHGGTPESVGRQVAREGKPSVEGRNYLHEERGKIQNIQHKICQVPSGIHYNGESGRVCYRTSLVSGAKYRQVVIPTGSRSSHKPQPRGQQNTEPHAVQDKRRPQTIRAPQKTRASVERVRYSGIMWCATVSTGAFVARRRGKIFVTGNTGQPKSHNVGAVISKMEGHGEFDGFGTALCPALEPICLARAPLSENTVAENVLRWGTGAINIDAGRIGNEKIVINQIEGGPNPASGPNRKYQAMTGTKTVVGRWPKNFAAQDGLLPKEYSRFFYSAKASKKERAGSDHPTVKPISLMRWLVRMFTPPGNSLVLDPFAGTGTTGVAAVLEGNRAILIEKEKKYAGYCNKRISMLKGEDMELLK